MAAKTGGPVRFHLDLPTSESPWLAYLNEDVGRVVYYNTQTEETTWKKPDEGFTWGESFEGRTPTVDPECLGDDYLESEWVPPSLEEARLNGKRSVCLQREGSLMCDINDMDAGEATVVYLHFLKMLSSTFFVLSLLNMPMWLTSYTGARLPAELIDIFSQTSIANTGEQSYEPCSSPKPDRALCRQMLLASSTNFSKGPFWPEGKTVEEVGTIFVWLDTISMLVVAVALIHFFFRSRDFSRQFGLRTTSTADYACQVWGLPRDALQSEIIDHFHDLYNLQHKDHAGRKPPEPELYPVGHYGNTCDKSYYICWVAECTIAHPTGAAIRRYQKHADLSRQLRLERAKAKKYGSGEFENEQLYYKADRKIQKIEWEIVSTLKNSREFETGRNPEDTVCAFVVFNNEESVIRALEDYTGSEHIWNRVSQPKHLRFLEEYPLIVKEAPDPADIIWENLEATGPERNRRSCITLLGTAVLLLLSFAAVLSTLYAASYFSNKLSNRALCDVSLPQAYFYPLPNVSNTPVVAEMDGFLSSVNGEPLYVRPNASSPQKEDGCPDGLLSLSINPKLLENFESLGSIKFDSDVCEGSPKCPLDMVADNGTVTHCPCIDASDDTKKNLCKTPSIDSDMNDIDPMEYTNQDVANCYCYQSIKSALSDSEGFASSVLSLLAQEDMCQDYAFFYIIGRTLQNGVAPLVTVANFLIELFVKYIVPYEHPQSVSALSASISMKLSVALSLNTVLVPVMSKVRLFEATNSTSGSPVPFSGADKYQGFPLHWYSTVGYTIMSTMALDIIVPHIPTFLGMFYQRFMATQRSISAQKTALTQRQLNSWFEGPEFDIATRLGYVLNTCACTILFSSGLPLLMPMALVSFFVSFWVDKYMLLRYYKRPMAMKSVTITDAVKSLSFAIFIHFALAIFTLGDSTLFVSNSTFGLESQVVSKSSFLGYDTLMQAASGASQQHMLPTLIGLVIVGSALLLYIFPTSPLIKLIIYARIFFGKLHRRVSEQNPPFTGHYIKPVLPRHYTGMSSWSGSFYKCLKWVLMSSVVDGDNKPNERIKLSDAEKLSGWVLKEERSTGTKFKLKEWKQTGYDDQGVKHTKGQLKRTWECIRDAGLHSYRMDVNPKYRDAMQTMYASRSTKKKYA